MRYDVDEYTAGRSIRFRFTAPAGFDGTHGFVVEGEAGARARLRHVLDMKAGGPALVSWPLAFRPLHDALLEDLLDQAEISLGGRPTSPTKWSPYVRFLRWLFRHSARRSSAARPA